MRIDDERSRERIRRKNNRFSGPQGSIEVESVERSVFLPDGNIGSSLDTNIPVLQGRIPHETSDIAGQCQSCLNFATESSLATCQSCWRIVCLPCATSSRGITVCPTCAKLLRKMRIREIIRKVFIEPFVEKVR